MVASISYLIDGGNGVNTAVVEGFPVDCRGCAFPVAPGDAYFLAYGLAIAGDDDVEESPEIGPGQLDKAQSLVEREYGIYLAQRDFPLQ